MQLEGTRNVSCSGYGAPRECTVITQYDNVSVCSFTGKKLILFQFDVGYIFICI